MLKVTVNEKCQSGERPFPKLMRHKKTGAIARMNRRDHDGDLWGTVLIGADPKYPESDSPTAERIYGKRWGWQDWIGSITLEQQ